jgi:hypothetical protein
MSLPYGAVPMRPQNPLVVRTRGGATSSIATCMGHMRTWLDCNRIELSRFEVVTVSLGNVAFDAQFRDLEHATLFRSAFGESTGVARWRFPWRYRRVA